MAKKLDLADEILSRAVGPAKAKTWLDRVPADLLPSLEHVRRVYQHGETDKTKTALADQIIASLADRGIHKISPRGVRDWLSAKS
jgi:hypothetical protein